MEQSAADEVRGRINGTLDYGDFADCDLVIEAITEDLGQAEEWRELDGIVKIGAVLATNTSSLSVIDQVRRPSARTASSGCTSSTPQVMPLLEVIQTVTTDEESLKTGFECWERLKKLTVHAKDKTGFIVNRLLVQYMLDAIRAS